jgi:hypothetical protein
MPTHARRRRRDWNAGRSTEAARVGIIASSKPALDYLTASGAAAISIMHIMAFEVDLSQHRLGGCQQP